MPYRDDDIQHSNPHRSKRSRLVNVELVQPLGSYRRADKAWMPLGTGEARMEKHRSDSPTAVPAQRPPTEANHISGASLDAKPTSVAEGEERAKTSGTAELIDGSEGASSDYRHDHTIKGIDNGAVVVRYVATGVTNVRTTFPTPELAHAATGHRYHTLGRST